MSLKYDIEEHPFAWSKEIVAALEAYKNGEKDSEENFRKFVNREISEYYYNELIERHRTTHLINKEKREREEALHPEVHDEKSQFPIKSDVICFLTLNLIVFIICLLGLKTFTFEKVYKKLFQTVSETSFLFVCGYLIYGVYALIRHIHIEHLKIRCIWIAVLCVLSLPYIPKLFGYCNTQIGSYYEAREYTETYVVFMSREPETNENRSVYTLTAQISRYEEEVDSQTNTNYITGERQEDTVFRLIYHINRLYFNNGGYVGFGDYTDSDLTILYPEKETEVTGNDGNIYYVTLTSQKAK